MVKRRYRPPEEMNGEDFTTDGGREIHVIVYDVVSRVGKLEGMMQVLVGLGAITLAAVLALVGTLLAKM